MQLHLDINPVPYHLKLNQTKPNLTKPDIFKSSITLLFFKIGARNFACNYIQTLPMYHTIQNQTKPNITIPNQTKFPYTGHNSVAFQNRISKFCMELHLDNIHLPYHSKPNQTKPVLTNHTKPNQIPLNRYRCCCILGRQVFI